MITTIRIPDEIHTAIVGLAQERSISMNAFFLQAIQAEMDRAAGLPELPRCGYCNMTLWALCPTCHAMAKAAAQAGDTETLQGILGAAGLWAPKKEEEEEENEPNQD